MENQLDNKRIRAMMRLKVAFVATLIFVEWLVSHQLPARYSLEVLIVLVAIGIFAIVYASSTNSKKILVPLAVLFALLPFVLFLFRFYLVLNLVVNH